MLTVDLHCHPNLKAFNSGKDAPTKNLWENIHHNIATPFARRVGSQTSQILKQSQSNFYRLAEADVRVFNISLYPIERGFLHLRNLPKALVGKQRINTMHEVITGFDGKRIAQLMQSDDYFAELESEYAYVEQAVGSSPDGKWRFVIANSYDEVQQLLQQPNTLIGIISIEGAHALGTGNSDADKLSETELIALTTQRIRKMKQWKYPPLTINLSHHFWNHLAGHSTTFKPPINRIINQDRGIETGITEAGWSVIRELLSTHNGKRILIDTKHMSVESRKAYYQFIRAYNQLNPTDTIPIVCSHTGIGGFATMNASIAEKDNKPKALNSRLYNWSINISDEEIRIIHQSGGIIGLMVDRGMLGGFRTVKEIVAIKDERQKRIAYCKLFWDNVFQIITAIGNASAWEVVALGTDFDGSITHMEPYESATELPRFQADLIQYLTESNYRKELWHGQTPEQMVERMMHQNAMKFYERFFI